MLAHLHQSSHHDVELRLSAAGSSHLKAQQAEVPRWTLQAIASADATTGTGHSLMEI